MSHQGYQREVLSKNNNAQGSAQNPPEVPRNKPNIKPNSVKYDPLGSSLKKDADCCKSRLQNLVWYHGIISRRNAETNIRKDIGKAQKDGTFLVRKSAACVADYVLSLTYNGRYEHYVIKQVGDCKYRISQGPVFTGLDGMISSYARTSNGLPTKLGKPCTGAQLPPPTSLRCGYTNLLHTSLLEGNKEKALNILQHKHCPNVDWKNEKGSTALHIACSNGYTAVLVELLENDATVDATDNEGYTPLHRACMNNQAKAVEILLNIGGANPNKIHNKTGNSPAHECALRGFDECTKTLLSLNVAAWPMNLKKKTPHDLAKENQQHTCAKILDDFIPPPAETSKCDWLHHSLNRQEAVALLEAHGMRDGLFLIRKHSQNSGSYVLTMSWNNGPSHLEIQHFEDLFFFTPGPLFRTLEHLVEHYCKNAHGLQCNLCFAITPENKIKPMFGSSITDVASNFQRADSFPPELPRPRPTIPKKPLLPARLDPKTIELGCELGQGEYGSVLRGTWINNEGEKIDVAIKTLNEQYAAQCGKEGLTREAVVMVKLHHPCIVKLIGISEGPPLMLVQELMQWGSMLDYLWDYGEERITRRDLYVWAGQIACGMKYLEQEGFVHRDLAARNILLADRTQAKVCDFGLSRAVGAGSDYYRASQGGKWPVKWYAPESVNYGTFSSASDVWSYGVTLWEMFSLGEQPYDEMTGSEVIQYIERKGRLKKPKNCPEKVFSIMHECWQFEPGDRPTFDTLRSKFYRDPEYQNVIIFLPELEQ